MSVITDIQKQKHNKSRVNIFADGEFVCGMDELAAASAGLKVGNVVTTDELASAYASGELNSAFERAVGYLALSLRSRAEIFKYLSGKGYAPDIVEKTLDKLDGYKYVDDYEYAQAYVKSKSKKYGSFRLAADLRQKGIAREIIAELIDGSNEAGIADVANKYLAAHRDTDVPKLKRFLAGRGFSWDAISSVVAELKLRDDGDDEY